MSTPKLDDQVTLRGTKIDRKSRLSLQEKELRHDTETIKTRRNTISEYTNKPRKKPKVPANPPIIEDEDDAPENDKSIEIVAVENEVQKSSKIKRQPSATSSVASKTSKTTFSYDNVAYEGDLKRTGSAATNSLRTSKAPSLQSLEIYQEQYCCFSRRTKCERFLLITVTILVIIIIVLIIVIAVLAKHMHDPSSISLRGW